MVYSAASDCRTLIRVVLGCSDLRRGGLWDELPGQLRLLFGREGPSVLVGVQVRGAAHTRQKWLRGGVVIRHGSRKELLAGGLSLS